QWQQMSSGGSWNNISGATNATYNPSTSVAGTFNYRVRVNDPNSGCASASSDPITLVVRPDAQISASTNKVEVGVGRNVTHTAPGAAGSTSGSLKCQGSASLSGTRNDIAFATSTTYGAPTVSAGTFFYRARVIDPVNGCANP